MPFSARFPNLHWAFSFLSLCPALLPLACGSSTRDTEPDAASLFERGTIADVRYAACEGSNLKVFSLQDSFGPAAFHYPDSYGLMLDCIVAATNCSDVLNCPMQFLPVSTPLATPCSGEPRAAARCAGNVATYCTTNDDISFWEVPFDCSLVGGTCQHGVDEVGANWTECVAQTELCAEDRSRCEGDRAIVCREDTLQDVVRTAHYDCTDVFGASCSIAESGFPQCTGDSVPAE